MIDIKPEKEKPLPLFRQDLQLFQGPDEQDGSPTYNIFDPVKGQYYKISWAESLIIKHLKSGMTAEDLCETLNRKTTLKVSPAEIKSYFEDAARHNLLSLPRPSGFLIKESENTRQNPLKWLIFHYLYIRVPLLDPDEFLKRTLKYVQPFASRTAFILYSVFSVIGIVCLFLRMEEFANTFTYFFNFRGFVIYALALTGVKIIHEFSHAYTAAHFNVRVPSMGVVFLVMWPVLFTDVTDSWKLQKRKHRLYISLAGIVTETVIAGLCTFGWAMASTGVLKSIFFVVSAVSWMSTLLINANPVMRFDGYYILSDLWGIDNLQSRSFAVARWKLRDWILGLKMPCPEPRLSEKRINQMVIYAICTWIYRLVLYTTIAVFVYYSFTKTIGLSLFILEIVVFIVKPLYTEARTLYMLRSRLDDKLRLSIVGIVIVLAFLWAAIPFPRSESFPAITVPHQEQVLYVPSDSVIKEINVQRGQAVKQGEQLISLHSERLETQLRSFTADGNIVRREIKIFGLEDSRFAHIPEKQRELEGILAKKKAVKSKLDELNMSADIAGEVISWDEELRVGQAVAKDVVLGKLADTSKVNVISFVPESLLNSVHEGQKVEFFPKGSGGSIPGYVEQINPSRARRLLYPSLASIYGGDLPVTEDSRENLILIESYYPVRVELSGSNEDQRYGRVGHVKVWGTSRSLLVSFFKLIMNLFWKESGF